MRMTLEQAVTLASKQSSRVQPDDEQIDFSDTPELTGQQLQRMKRVGPGRPPLGNAPRKMISIKLDPELIAGLKREAKRSGKPYQSLIHEILQRHIRGRAAYCRSVSDR